MSADSRKIFVLDTSVILYDATAIYNFEEHDVAVPITVLEELDHFKKGDNVVNLQALSLIHIWQRGRGRPTSGGRNRADEEPWRAPPRIPGGKPCRCLLYTSFVGQSSSGKASSPRTFAEKSP